MSTRNARGSTRLATRGSTMISKSGSTLHDARGSALLAVLVTTAIAALLLAKATLTAWSAYRALEDERRAAHVREKDEQARIEEVLNASEKRLPLSCPISMEAHLCAVFDSAASASFDPFLVPLDVVRGAPLFDYNALFEKARPCTVSLGESRCTSLSPNGARVLGSLEATTSLPFFGLGTVTIAATGAILISGTLRTTAPLLLVAGREVTLESLETLVPGLSVTIVAPHGEVTIRKILGAPRLTVFSSKAPKLALGGVPGSGVEPSRLPLLLLGSVDDRE